MKRVIIICEGETEREFCKNVLAPHLIHNNIFIQAPLIKRSMGGIVRWSILKKEIETPLVGTKCNCIHFDRLLRIISQA